MDALLFVPVLLGWLAGSFVNYTADVLPVTRRFGQPACPHCQTPFPWADYLTLRACRSCGKGRNLRTWLVQIVAVGAFLYFWRFPSERLGFALGAILLTYFGVLTVIDLEHRLILHSTSLVGALLGIATGIYIYTKQYALLTSVGKSLLGGLIGFGLMFLLYQLGAVFARRRRHKLIAAGQADDGEEEGLGGGDVYLLGVLGLMAGGPLPIIAILFGGAVLGGLASILLIAAYLIRRRTVREAQMTFIPYGPYYILAAFYLLFW
jgi:Flp pilus assembly protein protease CpaA